MTHARPRRLARNLFLGACLATSLNGAPIDGDEPEVARGELVAEAPAKPPSAELARVADALRRARGGGDTTEVVDELAALRDELVGPALELLTSRRVPVLAPDQDVQTLNRYQQQALLDALGRLPRETVAAALDGWRAEEPAVEQRVAEIRVRGAVGDAQDLAIVLDLTWRKTDQGLDRRLDDALREAVTGLVRRDTRALQWLRERHASLPDVLRTSVVLAVGAAGDARGVDFLTQLAHWHADLVGTVAGQVVALGASPSPDVNRELCGVLIEHLAQDDPNARSSIALALGSLGVPESVPELIRLLDTHDLGVRANAHTALREITGLAFPPAPALWSTWYRNESEWYRREAPVLWQDLESRQPGRAQAALRALAQRKLHRHEIAEHVAGLLVQTSTAITAEVRVQACATLARLRSPRALPALVDALQDRNEAVRSAAWEALVELTGVEHPPESEAWLALAGL